MEEFDTSMPVTADVEKQEHRQMSFLVLTLAGLSTDHDVVRDQILARPTVPTIDELFSRLLRLVVPPSHKVISSSIVDSFILASQTIDKPTYHPIENRRGGGRSTSRSKCSYCHKVGHTHDICHSLHGPPPSYDPTAVKEYNEFLRNRASRYLHSLIDHPIMLILPKQNMMSSFNIEQSSTLGSWIVDSGASDHISENKSLLFDIVYSQSLPAMTLANGI
ncbi:hypothetical protein CQW23_13476 [Capsicum baccatum]|uniref:Uncharacterized protein n=1 Tax=Capsicum baccatum TaxID=33114 RepID=A0A2G2WVJ5_CAPBA|nr:hypothetical protein CQW23_13476 [Capsicum baccatum]